MSLDALPVFVVHELLIAPGSALVNPWVLLRLNRRVARNVRTAMATPGFWQQLMRATFPLCGDALPRDAHWLLQRGRYASPDEAWRETYRRAVRGVLRVSLHVRSRPGGPVVRHVKRLCEPLDVVQRGGACLVSAITGNFYSHEVIDNLPPYTPETTWDATLHSNYEGHFYGANHVQPRHTQSFFGGMFCVTVRRLPHSDTVSMFWRLQMLRTQHIESTFEAFPLPPLTDAQLRQLLPPARHAHRAGKPCTVPVRLGNGNMLQEIPPMLCNVPANMTLSELANTLQTGLQWTTDSITGNVGMEGFAPPIDWRLGDLIVDECVKLLTF